MGGGVRVAGSIRFVLIAARDSPSGVITSAWLPLPAQVLELSFRYCPAPSTQRREHQDGHMS
jgi:hypothetical protein